MATSLTAQHYLRRPDTSRRNRDVTVDVMFPALTTNNRCWLSQNKIDIIVEDDSRMFDYININICIGNNSN